MHLVLRSSMAKGKWNFRAHQRKIKDIVQCFALKFGVRVISLAILGNHLHFQIQLTNRHTYRRFIRAMTAALAMAVTGTSRWNPLLKTSGARFWDHRPFTRVVIGWRAFLTLKDYVLLNKIEGYGYSRDEGRWLIRNARASSA